MSSANVTEMLVELIRGKKIGLETIALAAELIAADARFNHRVLESKGRSSGLGLDFMQLLDFYDDTVSKLVEIVQVFERTADHKSLDMALIDMTGQINSAAH